MMYGTPVGHVIGSTKVKDTITAALRVLTHACQHHPYIESLSNV